jgi:hypothetical protein
MWTLFTMVCCAIRGQMDWWLDLVSYPTPVYGCAGDSQSKAPQERHSQGATTGANN